MMMQHKDKFPLSVKLALLNSEKKAAVIDNEIELRRQTYINETHGLDEAKQTAKAVIARLRDQYSRMPSAALKKSIDHEYKIIQTIRSEKDRIAREFDETIETLLDKRYRTTEPVRVLAAEHNKMIDKALRNIAKRHNISSLSLMDDYLPLNRTFNNSNSYQLIQTLN